ncbi:MAG: class I SAM-dependent methyltransferase [Bdellovibrionales bacterium]|nr:class I SAM-dependent methyltransferase [Bdellovibrionales bacterium]
MSRRPGESTQWSLYYQAVQSLPPHRTLLEALDRFDAEPKSSKPRQALDLGAGSGRDSVEILRRGWRVLAVDLSPEGLEELRLRCPEPLRPRLETREISFHEIGFPQCDLINASFSLPFAPKDAVHATWKRIRAALLPGGRFAGHFLGDRDEWATPDASDLTFFNREEARELLRGLEIESFTEKDEKGATAQGAPHHWHVFSVVAKRPSGAPA